MGACPITGRKKKIMKLYFNETISGLGIYSGDELVYTDFTDLVDAVEDWKECELSEEERKDLRSAWSECRSKEFNEWDWTMTEIGEKRTWKNDRCPEKWFSIDWAEEVIETSETE